MITIEADTQRERTVWRTLFQLHEREPRWVLIGARMVELHAAEHGRRLPRASPDADALADALARGPNPVRHLAEILEELRFEIEGASVMGVGHHFVRDGVEIDVLAPEELGTHSQAARTTLPPLHTVEVPGGRQALARAELVEVRIGRLRGRLRRPNLLGAILLKTRAIAVDDAPSSQRSDLAVLLSLVAEPESLASQLRGRERSWLRRRPEMNDPEAACWLGLTSEQAQQGVAAFRVLSGL